MKAYMELVNNMLLTAEVQQTIVTPHIYISDCRHESFVGFSPLLEMLFVDDVVSFGGERRQELSTDCLLKCSCRHQPHVWFPSPDWSVSRGCRRNWVENASSPGILLQPTAGHTLPGYRLPQHVCSRERCEAGIPCDFCWWMVNVMPSQHGDSVGNAGSLQVAQKLRAGDPWAGLCAVWAMGVGLRLQLSAGAGKVRTSNWAFGFQF